MKKIILILACAGLVASCYNNRMIVGSVQKNEPMIEVAREWNHHLIIGLVPLDKTTMYTEEYIGSHQNYVIKTYQSFLNGLVSYITFGIYTPTETVFYIPLKDLNPGNAPVYIAPKNDIDRILE